MKKVILSLILVLACAGLKAQVAAFEKMGKIEGVEYLCMDKDTISQIFKESKKLSVDKLNIDVFGIEGIDNPKLFKKNVEGYSVRTSSVWRKQGCSRKVEE